MDGATQQKGLVTVKAQRIGTVVNPIKMVIAEGVEFFIAAVFAVDDQGLVFRHVIAFAQVLENGRRFRFEPFGEEFLRDVFVLLVLSSDDVEGALAVAGVHAHHRREGVDLHLWEERAAFGQFVAKEGRISPLRIDGLAPPDPAAEADDNHIGPLIRRAGQAAGLGHGLRHQQTAG